MIRRPSTIQTTYLHSHLLRKTTQRSNTDLIGSHVVRRQAHKNYKDYPSKVVIDILCREFIHKGGSSHHQQLIPASLVPGVLKSIHSSPTGGHLGIFKTVEKFEKISTGLASKKTLNFPSFAANSARKKPTHHEPINILWLNGPRVTLSITLASTSWAPYPCQMVINIFF